MESYSKFILRTPLLPINNTSKNDLFEEGLYLTSPSLYSELQKLNTGSIDAPKEIKKLKIALYKYQSRASSRCTPFGLFAGVNIGSVENENNVLFDSEITNLLKRKTRLDMNVVCSLAQELAKKDFVQPYLKFYPNNSIYKLGNSYRYVEYFYLNTKRIHKINKVDLSNYLKLVFEKAENGILIKELIALLISNEISNEDAEIFIHELINSQLLISELEPTITGKEFLFSIIEILSDVYSKNKANQLKEILNDFNEIKILIENIDEKITNNIANYKLIFEKIKKYLPELSETNLFQTDLFKKPEAANLNNEVYVAINEAIAFLNKITPNYINKNIQDFKQRFHDRYENAEVSILQAMDAETGVGYGINYNSGVNELVDDVFIFNSSDEINLNWDKVQIALHKILTNSIKEGLHTIKISETNFTDIDYSTNSLPHSVSVMFTVLNAVTNKIAIKSIGGSSAINLLGRFASGDEDILQVINAVVKHENTEATNSILAEIIHLPENRAGNILAHPVFREYEIPYLAKPSVEPNFEIDISDLYVSLKDNAIILRSKRLNKQIIPRLSNAPNFNFNSLPVYQFLCDLQIQYFKKPYLNFNWGVLESYYEFLPRVEYKNVVLSAAKWQIKKQEFDFLLENKSEENIIAQFNLFKEKYKLPIFFLVIEGDNELLIDTGRNTAIMTFVSVIKNKQRIILQEFLFDLNNPLVKDSTGNNYTNECIAIFLNEKNTLQKFEPEKAKKIISKRHFAIGTEWLYYKIYCGVKTADFILTDKIKPIIDHLYSIKAIDKWFFIRYADPDTHIRFRLHVTDFLKYGEIITTIKNEIEDLISEGLVFKLQTDTYIREIERYGDNSIELSETVFNNDSNCCLKALKLISFESRKELRWQYAIKVVDQFLNNFGLSSTEKLNLMTQLSQSFFKEHGGEKGLKIQLAKKNRELRKDMEAMLDEKKELKSIPPLLKAILKEKAQLDQTIISEIIELNKQKKLQIDFNELLQGYIHMTLNRIFITKQRVSELVIYDLLCKHYKLN